MIAGMGPRNHLLQEGTLVKIVQRRQVVVVCVLVAGLAAWGYAAVNWWQRDRNRVHVPNPAPDPALAAGASGQSLPPLSAADVLPPVELSAELTPEEEAEAERIGQLVEIAHEQWPAVALDGKSSAPTTATLMDQYTPWIHRLYHDSFQRCAPADAAWRSEAAQWLDDYVAHGQQPDRRPALREAGQRLVDSGCDDWLVRGCLFRGYDHVDQPETAASAVRLLQPLDSLATSGYSPAVSYRIYLAHAEAMSRLASGQPVGLKQAIDGFAAALSEPLSEDDRRFYALRFSSEMRGLFGQYLGQLAARLEAAPDADRWFTRLIRALWHIEHAWNLRGGGYADRVTEEGWSGFGAHMKKARVLLLQCWDEHPECPEAAAELVRVTMGVGGVAGDSPRFWFDEAVAAQFDFRDAYDRLRWSLRPRWGGSHGEMLAYGRECLATERFDTDVPWQFHLVLKEIGSEINDLRDVYQLDGVYDDYQKLLAGYRDRGDAAPALVRRWESRAACVAWLAGHNDAAQQALDRLGGDVDVEAFAEFGTTLGEVRRGLQGQIDRPPLAKMPFLQGVDFVGLAKHGHALLVGSVFSGAHVADTQRGCEIVASLTPQAEQAFRGFDISPDGTMLVTVPMTIANQGNTSAVWLWEVASQSKLREWTVPGGAYLAAFSPDGRYVAVGGMGGLVTLWDVAGERTDPIAQGISHSLVVSRSAAGSAGRRLARLARRRAASARLAFAPSPAARVRLTARAGHPRGDGACLKIPSGLPGW